MKPLLHTSKEIQWHFHPFCTYSATNSVYLNLLYSCAVSILSSQGMGSSPTTIVFTILDQITGSGQRMMITISFGNDDWISKSGRIVQPLYAARIHLWVLTVEISTSHLSFTKGMNFTWEACLWWTSGQILSLLELDHVSIYTGLLPEKPECHEIVLWDAFLMTSMTGMSVDKVPSPHVYWAGKDTTSRSHYKPDHEGLKWPKLRPWQGSWLDKFPLPPCCANPAAFVWQISSPQALISPDTNSLFSSE